MAIHLRFNCQRRLVVFGLVCATVLIFIGINRILDSTDEPVARMSATRIRGIPDVNTWKEIRINGGKERVLVDPRMDLDYVQKGDINWEAPYEVTSELDPFGIFRNPQLDPENPALIRYIRESVLIPPSQDPYVLSHPEVQDPSEEHATTEILPLMFPDIFARPGTFFEAGALDGEIASRTLHLERSKGWTGLNVEMTWPNARLFKSRNRKCWFAPVCISPHPWPTMKNMRFAYDPRDPWLQRTGTINRHKWNVADKAVASTHLYVYTIVECFPLYSLLYAANMTHVDFFNLDLEGVELQVLRTLPMEKLDLSIVVVEILHTQEGRSGVTNFMERSGYQEFTKKRFQETKGELTNDDKTFFHDHGIFFKR